MQKSGARSEMKRRLKIVVGIVAGLAIGIGVSLWAHSANFQILNPQGEVAQKQLDLLVFATALSLLVIIPVFGLLAFIAVRYREGNKKKHKYSPTWDHNTTAEVVWWSLPALLIGILSVVIWTSSHDLDPYKPLVSDKKPVQVQVVALQWRWLFIYPEENVASINALVIPEDTPVNFTITADAPMNSFWIPNLGGQVYAMNGMSTKLHLIANEKGEFPGSSANISGKGFAKMRFTTSAVSESDYKQWIKLARGQKNLDWNKYEEIAKQTEDTAKYTYRVSPSEKLYDKIIDKYMPHDMSHHESGH